MKVNDRILVDEKYPATIRYIGEVDGHSGEWIGIEWWNQKGKHNGTYQGKFYFQTEKSFSASFIRRERISLGHSFSQSIYQQYFKSLDQQSQQSDIQFSLFGKTLNDYSIEIRSLIRIDLSTQWLNEFDDCKSLYENLNQIQELNIRQNLLKNWSELWLILEKYFDELQILNVSNCRMNFDRQLVEKRRNLKEFILIDNQLDCSTTENLIQSFPNLKFLHLDKNNLTSISENFVNYLSNLTSLSLSENVFLKHWNPFINRLGKLQNLEELILNQCGIETIELIRLEENIDLNDEYFPKLKSLYLSDNEINSFQSIDQLSLLKSLISLSLLRNPIYKKNENEIETIQQLIIARLPKLIYLNRVFIERDQRRGAEIDYLQKYSELYFNQQLDFHNEHRQYLRLIQIYGEPYRLNCDQNQFERKGLCIRRNLIEIQFEIENETEERKLKKKLPSSMTIAKLKTFLKKLYPNEFSLNEGKQIQLSIEIDPEHQQILNDDYQEIHFYFDEFSQENRTSIIRIKFI